MRDAVVEHQPAGLEDAPDLAEVARVVGDAYVLEHSDAGDLVEKPVFGQVEVIEQLHAHAVAETELGDFRLDVIVLILRQRDAECVDAVALRGAKDQRTPAAADVEELLARVQHQLAADVIELLHLGLVERIRLAAEIRARIDHAFVEPEPIEGVRDVVMMLDVRPVSAPAAEPRSRAVGESIATVRDAADQRFRNAENAAGAAAEVDIVANVRSRERSHFGRRKRLQALPRAGVHIDLGSLRQRNAIAVRQNEGDGNVATAVAAGDDFLQRLVHARRMSTDECGTKLQFSSAPRPCAIASLARQLRLPAWRVLTPKGVAA